MKTIFTQKRILPSLKKAFFFVIVLTVILLIIKYYYETLPELDWQDFFWKQTYTFILIFLVYFLTENYRELTWKNLQSKSKKNNSN